MPKVRIIKPNISSEEREQNICNVAHIIEKIVEEEYRVKVKIELIELKDEKIVS